MPPMVTRLVIVVHNMPRLTPAMPLSDRKYFFLNEANIYASPPFAATTSAAASATAADIFQLAACS